MKKLILGLMLAVSITWSGPCDNYFRDQNILEDLFPPLYSGTYKFTSKYNTFKDGSLITVGDGIQRSGWDIPSLDIKCKVKKTEFLLELGHDVCYVFTIDCVVKDKIQFIEDIKWHTKAGYRKDGTRRWSRTQSGSTDITCYDKTGVSIIKQVNDPYFCR